MWELPALMFILLLPLYLSEWVMRRRLASIELKLAKLMEIMEILLGGKDQVTGATPSTSGRGVAPSPSLGAS